MVRFPVWKIHLTGLVPVKQRTGNREPETENRKQRTGNREPETENRKQRTGNREPETENRKQRTVKPDEIKPDEIKPDEIKPDEIKAHVYCSLWTNLYYATLLGGEFDNCYGQGFTPKAALNSLKLAVNIRRKKRDLQARGLQAQGSQNLTTAMCEPNRCQ